MNAIYRGATVALIYDKSLQYPAVEGELPAVTLMATDIDQIMEAITYSANLWANLTETGIGTWLVWRQMGPIALAPILVVVVCTSMSIWIGRLQGKYRGVWVQALQRRVGFTARTLGSMKSVKLAGMANISAKLLQKERKRELDKARNFRWTMVWNNTLGKSTQLHYHIARLIICSKLSYNYLTSSIVCSLRGTSPHWPGSATDCSEGFYVACSHQLDDWSIDTTRGRNNNSSLSIGLY
jgi:ATP-binding cassette subfamily C (CFTR/MRP) protein 1